MKKILYYIFTFIQIATAIGLGVVHNLSNKKAGVNHHLRFYKSKYNNEIFTNDNVLKFKIIAMIILIILLISLIYFIFKKRKINKLVNIIITSILYCILLIWMLTSTTPMSLLIYPYMIFATIFVFIIEIIKIFLI